MGSGKGSDPESGTVDRINRADDDDDGNESIAVAVVVVVG